MVERFRVETTLMARRDIDDIVVRSWREFGEAAASRYEDLLQQALTDLESGPGLAGCQFRPELGNGVWLYHLRHSRDRVESRHGRVGRPRHFLVFRVDGQRLQVLRALHDSRDLRRHLE